MPLSETPKSNDNVSVHNATLGLERSTPTSKPNRMTPTLSETPYLRLTTQAPAGEGPQNLPVDVACVATGENI